MESCYDPVPLALTNRDLARREAGKVDDALRQVERKYQCLFDFFHCIIRQPTEPSLEANHGQGTKSLHIRHGVAVQEAVAAGLKCAFISNGNATREVLEYIRPYVSAYKIDLKTMSDKNYRRLGAVRDHVLDGIRMVHELGFWLEVVTLVVPGFNDSNEELKEIARFLVSVSADIPWHVTAFHQDYKMTAPDDTGVPALLRAAEIGAAEGLRFVYAGNLPGQVRSFEHTHCPGCRSVLIERRGFRVIRNRLAAGRCPDCTRAIPGFWG